MWYTQEKMKFRSEKRTRIYSDNDSKSDPEDSMTEYVKVAVLGSQMASKKKKEEGRFSKRAKNIKTRVNHRALLIHQ